MKTLLALAAGVAVAILLQAQNGKAAKSTSSATTASTSAALPATSAPERRGLNSGYAPSGNFVIGRDRLGNATVRELAPGVSPLQSIGGSGGSLPPAKTAAQKATPTLKGTVHDQPSR
jgi:hypothetical protein